MATARVSSDGHTIWLPKGFGFKAEEIEVFRRGDEIILREKPHGERLFDAIMALPEDMVVGIRPVTEEQDRK